VLPRATVRSTFSANPASVSDARRFVRDTLRGWGAAETIDDAELLASELVTNAVIHARTAVEVICRLAGSAVQVEVVDGEPALILPDGNGPVCDEARTDGRGLLLPSVLARTWGVTYDRETKTVWFRLEMGADEMGTAGADA
jgi:anti-sigma regulatory factor (Ser/Thr protein kinase)